MLRFTERRNGKKMATIHVTHHLSSDDVANILGAYPFYDTPDNRPVFGEENVLLDRPSRAKVEELIRREYGHHGSQGREFWTEDLPGDEYEMRLAWAARVVRRLYPELDDDDLRRFEKG